MEQKPTVSIILSFFNEEDVIPELIERITKAFLGLAVNYEMIFVNDASTDNSLPLLLETMKKNAHIKVINMSRRFGVSECVLAGMQASSADAVIYLDADLQDPPEVIPELIKKWQEGIDVVHTVRLKRDGEKKLKLRLTGWAYSLIKAFSGMPLHAEAGDFKLLSRRAVKALLQLKEKTPYLRGLVTWIGFKQDKVFYNREARPGGITKFPLFRNFFYDLFNLRGPVGTLVVGLTSFSLLPIMLFLILGVLVIFASLVTGIVLLCLVVYAHAFPFWLWLLPLLGIVFGIQFLGIGVLGIYLGRIYQDVRNRPNYLVESTYGF